MCDVPGESNLFPGLYNIYIKPLVQIIQSFRVGYHHYVGDTQLYISLSKPLEAAAKILDQHLEAVVKSLRENRLKLNPDKTEVVLVGKAAVPGWC